MDARFALMMAVPLFALAARGAAETQAAARAAERVVVAKLSAQYGFHSNVVSHVELAGPFQTKSAWRLVAAKQPDAESATMDGGWNPIGAVSLCFVKNGAADCSEEIFRAKLRTPRDDYAPGQAAFFQHFRTDVVYSGPGQTAPLLRVKVGSSRGANGNYGVSTFLLDYDRTADRFRVVFFNTTGRNNNEETRFLENGPLKGRVMVVYPTSNAPYTYWVEVYQRAGAGDYAQIHKYRGNTRYGDENRLAVIDSEMAETLRQLGLWREGDPLPAPAQLPRGCGRLVLRKGVVWCVER